MEKKKPHYSLSEVKAILLVRGMDALTYTARNNARLLGLDEPAVMAVLLGLQHGMLIKSMTTHSDVTVYGKTCITRPARMAKRLISN
jgi:motility quorum-sensing regulator/GCU-specific mRNA interferase toxin